MYSFVDSTEPAPDLDALTHLPDTCDAFGRDSDAFDDDAHAHSLNEYLYSLHAAVALQHSQDDERASTRSERTTAHAHVRVSENSLSIAGRVRDTQRALFDDAVTRYLSRFARLGVRRTFDSA